MFLYAPLRFHLVNRIISGIVVLVTKSKVNKTKTIDIPCLMQFQQKFNNTENSNQSRNLY